MARTGWGRHTVVATGNNDENKQISVNAWNNDLDTDGIIGFTPETVESASSATPTVPNPTTLNVIPAPTLLNSFLKSLSWKILRLNPDNVEVDNPNFKLEFLIT